MIWVAAVGNPWQERAEDKASLKEIQIKVKLESQHFTCLPINPIASVTSRMWLLKTVIIQSLYG